MEESKKMMVVKAKMRTKNNNKKGWKAAAKMLYMKDDKCYKMLSLKNQTKNHTKTDSTYKQAE